MDVCYLQVQNDFVHFSDTPFHFTRIKYTPLVPVQQINAKRRSADGVQVCFSVPGLVASYLYDENAENGDADEMKYVSNLQQSLGVRVVVEIGRRRHRRTIIAFRFRSGTIYRYRSAERVGRPADICILLDDDAVRRVKETPDAVARGNVRRCYGNGIAGIRSDS